MTKKKFEGILICSDIDGTLFYQYPGMERGLIPENACRAIKYFQENGGRFTLATGRFPQYSAKALSQYLIPNAPTVALNGAVVYDFENDVFLSKKPIDEDVTRLTYDVIEKYPDMIRMSLQCEDDISYNVKRAPDGGLIYRNEFKVADKYKSINSREEFSELFKDTVVYKILYVFNKNDSDRAKTEIERDFPEYAVARSWIEGVELQRADADKGHSTRLLAELLDDVKLLVCVGDYENDISMVRMADIGYAVASAEDSVKSAAHRVTQKTCQEGAIEEIINDIEREFCSPDGK